MSRDYKSRATPQRKGKNQPVSGWIWFVGGLLVGLFICLLVWLKLAPSDQAKPRPSAVTRKHTSAPEEAAPVREPATTPKPRFDFYTILPEMEVVVPDPEPEETPAPTTSGAAPVVTGGAEPGAASAYYMLQMGSFRKYGDADKLKASLALVGIEAEIQRFVLEGGEVFHRVRSGPYTSGQVNSLRSRLAQNKINSLVIKLKK